MLRLLPFPSREVSRFCVAVATSLAGSGRALFCDALPRDGDREVRTGLFFEVFRPGNNNNKLRRLARKVARGSVDRTAYSPKYSLSFMSHHAERISLSVVRGVNRAIRSHLATLSARLARA